MDRHQVPGILWCYQITHFSGKKQLRCKISPSIPWWKNSLSSSSWRLWRIAIIQLLGLRILGMSSEFGDVKLGTARRGGPSCGFGCFVRGVFHTVFSIQGGDRFLEWNFNLGFSEKKKQPVFSPTNQNIQADKRKTPISPEKNMVESNCSQASHWLKKKLLATTRWTPKP